VRTRLKIVVSPVRFRVIDRRVLVPGAQPREVFTRAVERLRHQPIARRG
jgi:predicted DsbA family dithiol-disulfide isomerase